MRQLGWFLAFALGLAMIGTALFAGGSTDASDASPAAQEMLVTGIAPP